MALWEHVFLPRLLTSPKIIYGNTLGLIGACNSNGLVGQKDMPQTGLLAGALGLLESQERLKAVLALIDFDFD